MQWWKKLAIASAVAWLSACGQSREVKFFEEGQPESLSQWQLMQVDGHVLSLNDRVVPYDLNTPLFSDYAHKLRTVWMPAGSSAGYREDPAVDFPVGTIISKTFYYPLPEGKGWDGESVARSNPAQSLLKDEKLDLRKVRLIETRLLVRRKEGWVAMPYVWNADQTDAVLRREGDLVSLKLVSAQGGSEDVAYQVPDQNQCAGCHATNNRSRHIAPIGPKIRHLNRDFDYVAGTENQLEHWGRIGYLTGAPAATQAPRSANAEDEAFDIDARARAYLDINCGHCHSDTGAAITSGLHLDAKAKHALMMGFCKQPIAAGKGTGNRKYDIVPGHPEDSILMFRMDSDDPAVMMPELGRSVIHREGVELIKAWIAAQHGSCDA